MTDVRRCRTCDQEKPLTLFHKNGGGTHRYVCAVCNSLVLRLKRYGLTEEEYRTLIFMHDGRCAICRADEELCVDHDHDSGKVRGLLCQACNKGLGLLKDDQMLLLAAKMYLERHGSTGRIEPS